MVKSVSVVKNKGKQEGKSYFTVEFDLGYRVIKVFCSNQSISPDCLPELTGCSGEELYKKPDGTSFPILGGK